MSNRKLVIVTLTANDQNNTKIEIALECMRMAYSVED